MPKVKLLTVACENRPGTLSYVARVLGDAKVNILAFHCGTIGQNGLCMSSWTMYVRARRL